MGKQEKKSINNPIKFIDAKNKSNIINTVVAEILDKNLQEKNSFVEKLQARDQTANLIKNISKKLPLNYFFM